MSHGDLNWERDDTRGALMMHAHLDAGRWKTEAWALSDSLATVLSILNSVLPRDHQVSDTEKAEWVLARERLHRAQVALTSRPEGAQTDAS